MLLRHDLGWMDVVSTNLLTSAVFYRRLFDWDLSEPWDHHGGEYRMLTRDGHFLAGAEEITPDKGAPRWTVFIITEDIQELTAAVVEAGGTITFAPQPLGELGTVAMITDPLGATLGVWAPAGFDPRLIGDLDGRFTGSELITSDVAATAAFLTGTLGWKAASPSVDSRVAQFRSGGHTATVTRGEQGEWRPILGVASLASTTRAIELAGGTHQPARSDGIVEATDSTGAAFLLGQR